ncbi:MAG TPA: response regulator [Vicinamibacterales bacterium]|nr:response regulator [Vicinamibacterales bacterium]
MPHTLLLADDSVTIQRVIELTFAEEDVRVIAVSDGDQAIARLQASPPDIVLADIGMPGKNGYEVAQFVRQTPALAQIPVVLLTGAFEPVDPARAAEAGCDGVLAKPFEPQLVISRVKELLAKRQGSSPSAASAAPRPAPAPVAATAAQAGPNALNDYFDRLDAAFASFNASTATPSTSAGAPTPEPADPEIDWFTAATGPSGSAELWDLPTTQPAAAPLEGSVSDASPQPPVAFDEPPLIEAAAAFEPLAFEPALPVESPAAEQPEHPYGDVSHLLAEPVHAVAAAVAPSPEPAPVPPPASALPSEPPAVAEQSGRAVDAQSPAAPPVAVSAPARLPVAASLPSLSDAFAALLAAEANAGSRAAVVSWPTTPPVAVLSEDVFDAIARRVLERLSDRVVREAVAETVSRVAEQLVREEIERIKGNLK